MARRLLHSGATLEVDAGKRVRGSARGCRSKVGRPVWRARYCPGAAPWEEPGSVRAADIGTVARCRCRRNRAGPGRELCPGPHYICRSPLSQEPHHRHDRRAPELDHQGRREALQHERLGPGLLPGELRGARHRASRHQSEARARPVPARDGPERPGRRAAVAAPLLRHPPLPDSRARFGVPERHQGIRLRGHLHHRLPGEGEPAAPRGAGDRRVRRPARRGPRVRQQARAPGHPRPQREHQPPHRLQRLQGRGVHAAGAHGAEARAHRDDRAGAAHRARGPAQGGRRDGRAAHGGGPGQARHRGLRSVGQERW